MLLFELLALLIPITLALAALISMIIFLFGPPFVPTPMHVINELIQICTISSKDVVIDLGSGDGRLLIAAARKGARSKGWEINPFLVLWTKLSALFAGVGKRVEVYPKSYTTADITDATVIFIYNLPKFMPELESKMKQQLKKGSIIVTYKFQLPTIKPYKKIKEIYLYTID